MERLDRVPAMLDDLRDLTLAASRGSYRRWHQDLVRRATCGVRIQLGRPGCHPRRPRLHAARCCCLKSLRAIVEEDLRRIGRPDPSRDHPGGGSAMFLQSPAA
jgi:hypothetical protein